VVVAEIVAVVADRTETAAAGLASTLGRGKGWPERANTPPRSQDVQYVLEEIPDAWRNKSQIRVVRDNQTEGWLAHWRVRPEPLLPWSTTARGGEQIAAVVSGTVSGTARDVVVGLAMVGWSAERVAGEQQRPDQRWGW